MEKEIKNKFEEQIKTGEIISYKHYDNYNLIKEDSQYNGFSISDVYIIKKEVKVDQRKLELFEIYDKNGIKIASTDENNLLIIEEGFKEELKGKLGEFYNRLGLEKRNLEFEIDEEEKEHDEKESAHENSSEETLKKSVNDDKVKDEENEEQKIQKIEEELGLPLGDIESCTEIRDRRFYDKVPEVYDWDSLASVAYSKSRNEFIIIGEKNGKTVQSQSISPSQATMRDKIDLGVDGKATTVKGMTAIMKLNTSNNYDFAIDVGDTGEITFKELRYDMEHDTYLASDLMDTRTRVPSSREVEEMMSKQTNSDISDEVERINEINEPVVSIEEFDENIENDEIDWEDEAKKAKVSVEEFKRIYKEKEGTIDQKIEQVHQEIEEQYGAPEREHNHN